MTEPTVPTVPTTPQQGNWVPTQKNIAGNGAAALAGLLIMTANLIWPTIHFPPGYEAMLAAVLSFVVAYVTPNKEPPK
jgi:hypothetical protein